MWLYKAALGALSYLSMLFQEALMRSKYLLLTLLLAGCPHPPTAVPPPPDVPGPELPQPPPLPNPNPSRIQGRTTRRFPSPKSSGRPVRDPIKPMAPRLRSSAPNPRNAAAVTALAVGSAGGGPRDPPRRSPRTAGAGERRITWR